MTYFSSEPFLMFNYGDLTDHYILKAHMSLKFQPSRMIEENPQNIENQI